MLEAFLDVRTKKRLNIELDFGRGEDALVYFRHPRLLAALRDAPLTLIYETTEGTDSPILRASLGGGDEGGEWDMLLSPVGCRLHSYRVDLTGTAHMERADFYEGRGEVIAYFHTGEVSDVVFHLIR